MLYAALLWATRKELVTGKESPLSRATAFLSAGYASHAFWWEPLEMCRKLALCGWVLLIGEAYEQARVLVALLISIAFLTVHLVIRPFWR